MSYFNKNNRSAQRTISSKLQTILTLIANKTNFQPKLYGKGYILRCPAHNDKSPSLSASEANDGKVLLHCFCYCPVEAICNAINIKVSYLFPTKKSRRTGNA